MWEEGVDEYEGDVWGKDVEERFSVFFVGEGED